MTATHSGPYKSKLFNFVANQYRKVADKFEQALNQVKYAAVTTAQIIVYPIYVAVQTARLGVKRLQQQADKLLPQANEFVKEEIEETSKIKGPPEDGPVRKVLDVAAELVNDGPILEEGPERAKERARREEEIAARSRNKYIRSRFWEVKMRRADNHGGIKSNAKTAPYTVIVGIACSLDNRNLVLVTTGNRVLDVLSGERQLQLNRRILLEILRYQRDRRLREQLEEKSQPRELAPCAQLAYEEAGATQLWWQMLAWIETSNIAVKANLFDESTLAQLQGANLQEDKGTGRSVVIFKTNKEMEELSKELGLDGGVPRLQPLGGLSHSSLLLFLDAAIAALEKGEIAEVFETTAKTVSSVAQRSSSKSEKLLPQSKIPTESLWHSFVNQYVYPMAPLFGLGGLVPSQEEEDDLEYLEKLAAVKFASQGPQATELELDKPSVGAKAAPKQGRGAAYSAPAASKKSAVAEKKQARKSAQSGRWQLTEAGNFWASVSLSLPTSNSGNLKSVANANLQMVSISEEQEQQRDGLEYAPDFLDANSVSVGYVKHPLEQLLEWLDFVMLRLEQSIFGLGKWLHHLVFPSREDSETKDD